MQFACAYRFEYANCTISGTWFYLKWLKFKIL